MVLKTWHVSPDGMNVFVDGKAMTIPPEAFPKLIRDLGQALMDAQREAQNLRRDTRSTPSVCEHTEIYERSRSSGT